LGADGCIFNSTFQSTAIFCDVKNFEVNTKGEIFAIARPSYTGSYFLK